MTPVQERLLEMLAELVSICDANEISYYAAGGTTLGAIRHKGFIPWDDDVDIMMPRKDWERFVEIARQGLPPGRELCCLELDEHYNHVFGRYVDATSTSIHYNSFLGGSPQGLVVDIFILDPVRDAEGSYASYRETLSLYNDLVNDIGYSYPMSLDAHRLEAYAKRMLTEGRRAVLGELASELAGYDRGDCEYLVMRWAAAPRLFHRSLFGFRRYEPFEGLDVSVPGRCSDYLVQHYGDDWMYVPARESRESHDTITFTDVDYRTVQADYLPYLDVERVRTAILRRRAYHIRHLEEIRAAEDLEARICASFARRVTVGRAVALGLEGRRVAEGMPGCDLDEVFSQFYRWQTSKLLEGREEYLSIRRYHDPVYIDIGDELLCWALLNLIDTNRMGQAARILRVRTIVKGKAAGDLAYVAHVLDLVRMPASLADLGLADDARAFAEDVLRRRPANFSARLEYLGLLQGESERELIERTALGGLVSFPRSGEFGKYLADSGSEADGKGPHELAEDYRAAYSSTTHAFIAQDIRRKLEVLDPDGAVPGDPVQQVPGTLGNSEADIIAMKTERLLGELCEVCAAEGIRHVLGPTSTRLALSQGGNELGVPRLDFLVFADDLGKLVDALLHRADADRFVDCWKTNGRYRAFQVDYVDTSTTYLQLGEGDNIAGHGVKVTVTPIRRVVGGAVGKALDVLETGWEVSGYRFTKAISFKRALSFVCAHAAMAVGRRASAAVLFDLFCREYGDVGERASIRYPDREAMAFRATDFETGGCVSFGRHDMPVAAGMQGLIGRLDAQGPGLEPITGNFARDDVLLSATLPFADFLEGVRREGSDPDDLFSAMKRLRLGMLPLANELRIRNRALLVAQRTRDRKRWYDYLSARDEAIKEMLASHDMGGLARLFEGYERDAREYARRGLGLCPCREYLDILLLILEWKGDSAQAGKIADLVPEAHYRPVQ